MNNKELLITDCNIQGKRAVKHFSIRSDNRVIEPADTSYSHQASAFSRYAKDKDWTLPDDCSPDCSRGELLTNSGKYCITDQNEVVGDQIEESIKEGKDLEIDRIARNWDEIELRDAMRLNMYRITGYHSNQKSPLRDTKNKIPSTSKERLYVQQPIKQRIYPNSRVLLRELSKKTKPITSQGSDLRPYDLYIKQSLETEALEQKFGPALRKSGLASARAQTIRPLVPKLAERSKSSYGFKEPQQSFTGRLASAASTAYNKRNTDDRMYVTRLHRLMKDLNLSLNHGRL